MWGKTLAFVILFILAFGLIVAIIPDSFHGVEVQESDAFEAITASSLIVFENQGADNMTYPYSSYDDGPDPPNWNISLAEGEYLDVGWTVSPLFGNKYIGLTHVGTTWLGVKSTIDIMKVDDDGAYPFSSGLTRSNLITGWDSETNSSAYTAKCEHASVSIVFKPAEGYDTISASWDAGELWYAISYGWNTEDAGFNIMSFVVRLLTFQGVGIGVPGQLGSMIDAIISTLFYIAIAVVAYVVITSVIPFIPGVGNS
jgi:hypothetical protein